MSINPETPGARMTSRRDFLYGTFRAAGALAVGTSLLGSASGAPAGVKTWDLRAERVDVPFPDGATVPFFRYTPVGGATRGDLPFLRAKEGTLVAVSVRNDLPFAIRPQLVESKNGPLVNAGQTGVLSVSRSIHSGRGPRINPGQTGYFAFTMPAAGTYLFAEERIEALSSALGIGAMVVSRPANGASELYPGGPQFDREYALLYQDADERWNTSVAGGQLPNTSLYEPNYFTTNGLSFPDLAADPDCRIVGSMGDRILIRFGNLGYMRQSIHFHGYHVEVVCRDNVPEASFGPKDTVPVPRKATVDVLLTPNQTGVFPVHPHSLTAVTSNGLYPYGQLTLIDIT